MESLSTNVPAGLSEALLRDLFETQYAASPAIFSPHHLNERHKAAGLALIEAGHSLEDTEKAYLDLIRDEKPDVIKAMAIPSRNREHRCCLATVLQCLLGMPQYKDRVMGYLLENFEAYQKNVSFGFLGARGMYGTLKEDQRSSCVFSSLPGAGPEFPVSNLCRDQHGKVLSPDLLDHLLISEPDAHGFLMSAIANRDPEAIEGLLRSGRYLRRINKEETLFRVGTMIQRYPSWELGEALGPLLTVKNHETAIAQIKRLVDAQRTPVHEFADLLWPGISELAIANLVSHAVKFRGSPSSARNFLIACVEAGFDLYLGLVEARSGFGAMLDALQVSTPTEARHMSILESYEWFTVGDANQMQMAPLLLQIPPAILAQQARADDFLYEVFGITGEKSLLALGGHKLKGKILEDELGL